MNFLNKFINLFKNKKKKKVEEEKKLENDFFYSYIFNNDSIWLFYKKYNYTENNKKLNISF